MDEFSNESSTLEDTIERAERESEHVIVEKAKDLFATLDDFEFPAETGDWSKVAKHFKTKL